MSRISTDALTKWVSDQLAHCATFLDRDTMLRAAVQLADPSGLFCEFGVGDGDSIRIIAAIRPKVDYAVHGFDSFYGLPEDGRPEWPKGKFSRNGNPPAVPRNVSLHVGMFTDTIPKFLRLFPGEIAFLHIDCDLYSSTRTVLAMLAPRLFSKTLIQFDEFWKFPGWEKASEARALFEFCQESGRQIECLGTVVNGEQTLFRVV